MKLNKKIIIGTLATTVALATPIVALVSCGKEFKYSEGVLCQSVINNSKNIEEAYTLLKKQVKSDSDWLARKGELGEIMDSDGTLKDAASVDDNDLEKLKHITLDITFAKTFQAKWHKLLVDIQETYKTSKKALDIWNKDFNSFTPKFFETLTNKENAKKWSKKIDNLYKQGKFALNFNLVLPKELKEFDLGISIKSAGIVSIGSIQKEDASIKVNGFFASDVIDFKIDSLPSEIKALFISNTKKDNIFNDSDFILSKLPKNLKVLDIIISGLTKNKEKEIKDYINKNNLKKYSDIRNINQIDNPEPLNEMSFH